MIFCKSFLYTLLLLCAVNAEAQTGKGSVYSVKAFLPFWKGSLLLLKIDGQVVYSQRLQGDVFSYTGTSNTTKSALLQIEKDKNITVVPLFIEGGTIKVKDRGGKLLEATGTQSNDAYIAIKKSMDSVAGLQTGSMGKIKSCKRIIAADYIKANPQSAVSLQLLYENFYLDNVVKDTAYYKLYQLLDEQLKNTALGRKIGSEALVSKATATGATAVNFFLQDTARNTLPLFEAGGITLVHFWASWCVPCRKQNKALVQLYQQYSALGFKITTVTLDQNFIAWKNALETDSLPGIHLQAENKWNSKTVKTYGVKSLPANFLIGPSGNILASNLSVEGINELLAQLLQKDKRTF